MGELANLFELLHGAPSSFRTLRGELRTWSDHELTALSWARQMEELKATPGVEVGGNGFSFQISDADPEEPAAEEQEEPRFAEQTMRLWLEPPSRSRQEAPGQEPMISNDGFCAYGHLELFNPLAELPGFEVELAGEAVVAGRAGFRIKATSRRKTNSGDAAFHFRFRDAGGADEVELVVDRERGFVLRREARIDGQPFAVTEFTEVELDADLEPELFERPEEPVALSPERYRPWTIERVASTASFTVFVPAEIWPNAHMSVSHSPEQPEYDAFEYVHLSYSDMSDVGVAGVMPQISMLQRVAPEQPNEEGVAMDECECDGAALFAGEIVLTLRLNGTQIEIQSRGIELDDMRALLKSLEPARTGPPPGFE